MNSGKSILVWDVPTRLFHWMLAVSFAGAFLTAESERWRDVHVVLGYTMLGLIGFRLCWGLIGTRYARFSSFAFGPAAVGAYLRSLFTRAPVHYTGHNPAGGIAVFLLLGLGLLTGMSGWLTFNDAGGEWLEEVHEGVANTMLAVVFVHVAGVALSSVLHRENLVRAMVTGHKRGESTQAIRFGHAWLGAMLLASVISFWYWYPQSLADVQAQAPVASGQVALGSHRNDRD